MKPPGPLWILAALGLGCFWIYDGLSRGYLYAPLLGRSPERLTVLEASNPSGRSVFPDYKATGQVDGVASLVVVKIFQGEYRNLRRADNPADSARVRQINVYRLNPEGSSWVTASKIDESKPIFTMLGISFSWHFPLGILFVSISSAWLLRRRWEYRRNQLGEVELAQQNRLRWQKRESWYRKMEAWRKRNKPER